MYNIRITDHHWSKNYVSDADHAANCQHEGSEWIECEVCHAIKPDSEKYVPEKLDEYEVDSATGEYKWDAVVEPTCDKDGYKVAKCKHCDDSWVEELPAIGHDWKAPTYQWSNDKKTVTAARTCSHDAENKHPQTETVNTIANVTKKATLSSEGIRTYTAIFANAAFKPQTKTEPIPKLIDISKAKVTLSAAAYTYNGKVNKPAVKSVIVSGDTLKADTDYTVKWSDAASKKAGSYTVTVTGKNKYGGTKKVTYKINKAANPLSVKGKTAKIKYKAIKKKAQKLKVGKVIKFKKKGQGKMTYKLSSAKKKGRNFKKSFKINAKTGKVTVKKKLKKGTYNVTVKVKAAGNANYKASAVKTVTFKVKIK